MKKSIILFFMLLSSVTHSQELNLNFFEKLNEMSLSAIKEILVEGYGFKNLNENEYVHPKSFIGENNFLIIKVQDLEYKNKSKTFRSMDVRCSNNLSISKFKSELLEQNYEYQGSSNDKKAIDFNQYKKNEGKKEVDIIYVTYEGIKKYQIIFITKE